jgi:transglutaminase-like putative cysteine protease
MKKQILFLFFLVVFGKAKGDNYAVGTIPEELKTDAYAVVRESSESFIQQDERTGIYKKTHVITVLNNNGKSFSDWMIYENKFRELKSFSGTVYNAEGKIIKKIGKKDLNTTAFSSADLATDDTRTFYQYQPPFYPYTIKYEYEMKYKNGILFYPTFDPVPGFHVALEKADYKLQIPVDYELRSKKQGTDIEPEKTALPSDHLYKWSLNNIAAVAYEKFAPVDEIFPAVYFAPEKFCVENKCGNMATWEKYGEWAAELLKGRDQLPQKTIDKVLELTQNISSKREKAKILYEYLQKTTHYVSIQLGIGGWQPMKAEEVVQTGFGDCKALSNYMKSLLKTVDIPSYYTVISTKKERFFPDFPSFGQANHVILMVPFENDTVLLECTSQILPFGYISSLAGHDALAVGDDRSFFYTLPEDDPKENEEINRIQIQLKPDGTGRLDVHSTLKNREFDRLFYELRRADAQEENDLLAGLLRVHKPRISNIRKTEIKSEHPQLDIEFTVDCEDFATQTDSRMLVQINPARTALKGLLTGSSRTYDIEMNVTKLQRDTILFHIPEGYTVETKPKATEIQSEYGYFQSKIAEEDGKLIYTQTLEIRKGRYPATEFEEMKKFYNRIETLQNSKISFKR